MVDALEIGVYTMSPKSIEGKYRTSKCSLMSREMKWLYAPSVVYSDASILTRIGATTNSGARYLIFSPAVGQGATEYL